MSQLRIAGGTVYDPANGVDGDVRDLCIDAGRFVSDVAADAPIDRRARNGRHAGWRGHPRARRGQRRQSGAAAAARGASRRSAHGAGLSRTTDRCRGRAPAAPCRAPSRPAIATRASATPRCSTPPSRPHGAPVARRARRHADRRRRVLRADGQRRVPAASDRRGRAGAGARIRRLAARRRRRLRDQDRESRRRRAVEARIARPHRSRYRRSDRPASRRARFSRRWWTPATRSACRMRRISTATTSASAGNVKTTIDSMRAVGGRRAHFTHLQFHSYAQGPDGGWRSGAREISEYVNAHPEISGDVGQVMFGPATTLTADAPVEYLLHKSSGRKWVNVDIELETGCGIVPYAYKEKAAVAALQWVVGLELFLLSADPWRLVLSTDHPNGGSFMSYPELIRLLMDRTYRDEPAQARESQAAGGQRARRWPGARVHAERDRRDHAGRSGAAPRSARQGTAGRRRRGRRHGLRARRRSRAHVRDAALRDQGRARSSSRRGSCAARRPDAGCTCARRTTRPWTRDLKRFFDRYATISFENYPVGELRDDPLAARRRALVAKLQRLHLSRSVRLQPDRESLWLGLPVQEEGDGGHWPHPRWRY